MDFMWTVFAAAYNYKKPSKEGMDEIKNMFDEMFKKFDSKKFRGRKFKFTKEL